MRMRSKLIGSTRAPFVSSGLIVATIGMILVLLTLLAPFIGLGVRYDFILYKWFELPRTMTILLGGALTVGGSLVASVPSIRQSLPSIRWYTALGPCTPQVQRHDHHIS